MATPANRSVLDLLKGAVGLTGPREQAPALAVLNRETPEPTPDADAAERERKRKDDLIQRVLDYVKTAEAAYSDQVTRELDDLNFEIDQWPKEFRDERKGGVAPDGHVIPAKPCLEINKLDQPIQQVLSEARLAKLAIQIKPRGQGASKEVAAVRQGLIRAIEVDSRAQLARLWALDRCVKCGRGAYRISKRYSNDGDFDMDLVVERILNQHSVLFDPFATEPDWSDGEWVVIFSDIPESEYRRRWPDSNLSRASSDQLQTLGNSQASWVSGEPGKRAFRVAECYYIVHDRKERVYGADIGHQWGADLNDEQKPKVTHRRQVDYKHVEWCITNVMEVLDEEIWEGRYIPIVPVTGKEYNVNGKRIWRGLISLAKDAQRSYNVMRSRQIEAIGLASLSTWVMAEGQDEGYEEQWDRANTSSFVRLIYKPTTFEGQMTPAPSRDTAEPAIAAITQAVREADQDIKATTGRYDPSLGKARADQSGKAIRELKVQGESGTSNYLWGLAEISMMYEGKVLNDMLEYVYDRPGRIARLLGTDDQEREVMLNKPFQAVGGSATPQPLPPGQQFDQGNPEHQYYDLKNGSQYRVVVSVGPSRLSEREDDREFMSELAKAAPQLVPVYADLWVRSNDSHSAGLIADRLKRVNPNAQGDSDGKRPVLPPEVQAQVQQMQQQIQQMQKALQEANQKLAIDEAKQKAQIQTQKLENESRERIAAMEAKKDLLVEQARLRAKTGDALLQAEIDRLTTSAEQKHDRLTQVADQRHEATMQSQEALLQSMLEPPEAPEPPAESAE